MVQPESIEVDGKHQLNHLVSVNQDKNHAILKAYCTDPELKDDLASNLRLYTNSAYERIASNGEVLYLFNNEEKGSYYMTATTAAIEKCSDVTLEHSS